MFSIGIAGSSFRDLDLGLTAAQIHKIISAPQDEANVITVQQLSQRLGIDVAGTVRVFEMLSEQKVPFEQLAHRLSNMMGRYLEENIFWSGDAACDSRNGEKALVEYQKIRDCFPHNGLVYAKIGVAYRIARRYKEALYNFTLALKLSTEDKRYWIILRIADVYIECSNWGKAKFCLQRLCNTINRYHKAHQPFIGSSVAANAFSLLAETYRATKDYKESLKNYNLALQWEPKNHWIFTYRAMTYKSMKLFDKALDDNNQATELTNGRDSWVLVHRGETHRDMGNFEDSLRDINRAIELTHRRDSDWILVHKALTYEKMGYYKDALDELDLASSINPENEWIKHHRERIFEKAAMIFVSYAREDGNTIDPICESLTKRGFRIWRDKDNLLPGMHWEAEIENRMEDANFLLIFLSKHTVGRKRFQHWEIKKAVREALSMPSESIYIIPVRLDDCEIPRELRDIHFIDLIEAKDVDKIVRSIESEMKRK